MVFEFLVGSEISVCSLKMNKIERFEKKRIKFMEKCELNSCKIVNKIHGKGRIEFMEKCE